jgi:hypothetical protein
MEVFLVAYACPNLNLEIFAGTRPFSVIENTITKVVLCCEVKTVFALKFN